MSGRFGPAWASALRAAAAATALCLGFGTPDPVVPRAPTPVLASSGIVGAPGAPPAVLPPGGDAGAYVPGSNVLRRPDGELLTGGPAPFAPLELSGRSLPGDAQRRTLIAEASVRADRAWLGEGRLPGRSADARRLAERALLDLRLMAGVDGAVVAGPVGRHRYVWPRDASWVAAALAATGHHANALSALRWIASVQEPDGTWQARYYPRARRPVQDGRDAQLDAVGWFAWAVWVWVRTQPAGPRAAPAGLEGLWPTVSAATDAATRSLDGRGLPRATPDYWEKRVDDVTVSTTAALRSGLRAAANLAATTGRAAAATRWSAAATRLDAAIRRHFGTAGYRRTPDPSSGSDAAVALLGPPFAPSDPAVDVAVAHAQRRLLTPSGGLRPGEAWSGDPTLAWTPASGLALLAAAATGRRTDVDRWVRWFADHRTPLGALSERVDATGRPVSVAPLAWTDAIVLLALVADGGGLPMPPVLADPAGTGLVLNAARPDSAPGPHANGR